MENTSPPNDQFRAIAAVNQQPVYFPNELGMQRLRWVWGILSVMAIALFFCAIKYKEFSDVATEFKALQIEHRSMWEMVIRGESNKERFFREHGYPAQSSREN